MKKYLLLLVIVVAGLACNKSKKDDSALLEGTWKMVSVKEKNTLIVTSNPGNQGDVIMVVAAGKLSAKTPSNDIWPTNYTTGANHQLLVPAIGGTKVGENSWGNLFYSNMYFIESYSFTNNNLLHIGTRDAILNFERR